MTSEDKVARFPVSISPEEWARRLKVEVDRLARQSPTEWLYYVALDGYAEKYGVNKTTLRQMVEATVKAHEKEAREAKAEKRQEQIATQRAEKQQTTKKEREQREERRAQQQADKAAEKRQREREQEFEAILKLPIVEHEPRLAALAKRSGEDIGFLRDEFSQLVETEERSVDTGYVEPWPEPVNTHELLEETMTQLRRFIVIPDDDAAVAIAIVLWVAFAWLIEITEKSPRLKITSPKAGNAKTRVCTWIGLLTSRACTVNNPTGPVLYRLVDHLKPTLIVDEADDLFKGRPDIVRVFNTGYDFGKKIPRMDRGHIMREFDPFCAMVVAGNNPVMTETQLERCISVKVWPKLKDQKVDALNTREIDERLVSLQRKWARWRDDNAATIKVAKPAMPDRFFSRLEDNWRLQFATADLAGGNWPKIARNAAIKLSREQSKPGTLERLLTTLYELFASHGPAHTVSEIQTLLAADQESEWADFNGPNRPISKTQIGRILGHVDIESGFLHPRGQRKPTRGYRVEWFKKAFLHILGKPLPKCATVRKGRG
jgi:putative DNA primase/helicase